MTKKRIQKSNHRIFAVALSTLVIIGLALMVPLAMMSLNKTTEDRSQAKAQNRGNTNIDEGERNINNKKFKINSRKGVTEYIYFDGTYIPEINNTLIAGTYELDIQYKADEIAGKGLAVALVCVSNSCTEIDGSGTVGVNQALYNYNLNNLGVGVRRMKTQFTLAQNMQNNTVVRLFASDGTSVEFDFVRLYDITNPNRQLLKNSSFTATKQVDVERINETAAGVGSEIYRDNSFANSRYQSAFKSVISNHYGQPNVLMFNGPGGNRDMIIRSRARYGLDPNKDYRLELHYFMPKHNFDIGSDTFNFDIHDVSGGYKRVSSNRLAMKECDYNSGQGCTYTLLTSSFSPDVAGNYEFNFNVNTQIELFVNSIKVVEPQPNGTTNVIWTEEFNNVSPKQNRFIIPEDWVVRESWKQAYGVSYPWDN